MPDRFSLYIHELKERETKVFRSKCMAAQIARDNGAASWLADAWGCSTQMVNGLAAVWDTFTPDVITPDVPLSVYRACMETDEPAHWLLVEHIGNGLSAREIRDGADIAKGRHRSRVPWMDGRAQPERHGDGVLLRGIETSGKVPAVVEVKAYEVLEDV